MALPIIRITVEGMKHEIANMLSDHLLAMDEHIKAALDAQCTPQNIQAMVANVVKAEIDAYVRRRVSMQVQKYASNLSRLVDLMAKQAIKAPEE